jgi:hypothetical protein
LTDTLGPYELIRLLGRGGMGEVHLARDTRLERTVALKLLPAELADDAERRSRLLRVARAAAALDHPNITTIHDIGEAGGRDYIAQEYLEGRPLSELIAERRLPLDELADLAVPLADALQYAHERGIIHRDLKPAPSCATTAPSSASTTPGRSSATAPPCCPIAAPPSTSPRATCGGWTSRAARAAGSPRSPTARACSTATWPPTATTSGSAGA